MPAGTALRDEWNMARNISSPIRDASKNHATFAIASSDTAISRMEPFSLLSARSQSGNVALMKSEIVD